MKALERIYENTDLLKKSVEGLYFILTKKKGWNELKRPEYKKSGNIVIGTFSVGNRYLGKLMSISDKDKYNKELKRCSQELDKLISNIFTILNVKENSIKKSIKTNGEIEKGHYEFTLGATQFEIESEKTLNKYPSVKLVLNLERKDESSDNKFAVGDIFYHKINGYGQLTVFYRIERIDGDKIFVVKLDTEQHGNEYSGYVVPSKKVIGKEIPVDDYSKKYDNLTIDDKDFYRYKSKINYRGYTN